MVLTQVFIVSLWPQWEEQTVGSEGRNWETRQEATALAPMRGGGDWTRVGAKQVEKST